MAKPSLPFAEPPPFEEADVYALKALKEGNANESQQRRALSWILNEACGMGRDPFRADNARLSDHLGGRQTVGRAILELLNAKAMTTDG